MRIGITCYPTYGGSGVVAAELGIHLADRGHEVHFISYALPFRLGSFRERVFFHEVEMEHYPLFEHPPYSLALAVQIHATARQHDLDLIHVHYAIPHATSAWIAREMLTERRLPVVTTLHGTDITLLGLHPSFHAITRFSIEQSQGLTAVSRYLAEETARNFGVPTSDIEVIPNFIDPEVYRPGKEPCHRATLAPAGEKILMHVSNFRPVKRVPDCVDILARVRREVPARLVLIGDGPERPRVLERAEALGVTDHVLFLGKHSSVDELLACADVLLLPSGSESFGLVALEAMASGAPVVSTRAGGLSEVIPDGRAGYLLEVGDIEGMTEATLRVICDDDLWRKLSAGGREHALEHFSSERVVPRYEAYYRKVLAENGR